jgi:3-oxoadipate enol-lactonase
MPILKLPTHDLHYQLDGPDGAPAIVLSNSLGTTLEMWTPQLEALSSQYRVLRYDTRGHGSSTLPEGATFIDDLGRDVLALLDALEIERAHFCGISMGGLTGQWLGVHAPQRLNKLIVCNTAARVGTLEGWQARAQLVRNSGMEEVAAGAAERWFTTDFIMHKPGIVELLVRQLRNSPPPGYAACCDALGAADLRGLIKDISVPTLVIAGAYDPVTTVHDAEYIASKVKGARVTKLAASHLSNVEAAAGFNDALLQFLAA